MKTIPGGIFISLLLLTTNVFSQNKEQSPRDSISIFYSELFEELESKYLDREKVNWPDIKSHIVESALKSKDFKASLNFSTELFDTIGCNHCQIFTEHASYRSTLNKEFTRDDFSEEFLREYENGNGFNFEVKLIGKDIGYINMPGMLLINLSQDSLNHKTQIMYDQIVGLRKKENIKAWIIDLRFNIGGNAYVMLATLYDLLGDVVVYNTLDANGKQTETNRLENGAFFSGDSLQVQTQLTMQANSEIPVALITGKMTGSAGEDIAVAFKHRENVIFIGEATYGLLTGNDVFKLPFNADIALTQSYIVDANNQYREYISPDIEIIKNDNFEDLTKDAKIIRAIEFFKTRKK